MIYYLVNEKKIYNPYLAYYESFISRQPIKFYCFDEEYDKIDWTKEPEESFELLMDQHAHRLRNKYERLILSWSGGTDSHTIYNVFKRNQIHLDEIIYKIDQSHHNDGNGKNIYAADKYADWLIKNHWDHTTKITMFDEYDPMLKKLNVKDEDWIFENKPDAGKYFGVGSGGLASTFLCENSHAAHKWGLITGLEKPWISKVNGHWYTRQRDTILSSVMGQKNIECFFLEPNLNLKQSHMAKKVLKKSKKKSSINEEWNYLPLLPVVYASWSTQLGRHEELTHGISLNGKLNCKGWNSVILDLKNKLNEQHDKNFESGLLDRIKNSNKLALDYLKGFYNLANEKDFYQFLNKNYLKNPGSVLNRKDIFSKAYYLGT
jgi:hypothetical protein